MTRKFTAKFGLFLVLALGLVTSGCAEENPASPPPEFVGEYELISVDGMSVPASISHDGVLMEVVSGNFTIGSDGTCRSRMVFVPPSGPETVREVTGTYTANGSQLTMRWHGAGTTIGTVEGDTFTMDNEGLVLVYRKQPDSG